MCETFLHQILGNLNRVHNDYFKFHHSYYIVIFFRVTLFYMAETLGNNSCEGIYTAENIK